MKLRTIISSILAAAAVLTNGSVISVPIVSAETTNTDTVYREDFEDFESLNYSPTLKALNEYGWYAADHNTLYDVVDSVPPYSTYSGKFAKIDPVDNSKVLRVVSAGEGNNTQNSDIPQYGYAKTFPGVPAGEAASGTWEISFDFKPYLLKDNTTQFAFTLNTGDLSDVGVKSAQHNIIAGYGQRFYLGYRDYNTLLNDKVQQGTLKASEIGGVIWYTVRTILNCDDRYYSVELYNRETGALIARRSPVSFDADETIGFLKISALGYKQNSCVFVDNISIEKAEKDTVIYNETFDELTDDSYRAEDGMTTGAGSEDLSYSSYFEGFTPWRFHEGIGNSYCLENDEMLSSQVARLGDDPRTTDTTEVSGLVYMQACEPLLNQRTARARGMLKTSFKIKPEMIVDDVSVNVIADAKDDITSDESALFKITNNEGSPAVIKGDGGYSALDPAEWYDVELICDAVGRAVNITVKDLAGNEIASSRTEGTATPDAVSAVMFNVDGGSSVLVDDIKLEYDKTAPSVSKGEIVLTDRLGNIITDIGDVTAGSTVNVLFSYDDGVDEAENSTVVLAFYDDNNIVGVHTADYTVQPDADKTDEKTIAVTIPSELDMDMVDKISVFVWNGLQNIKPLTRDINLEKQSASTDIYKDYVDFTVNVESGREPVILQLTDTQIVDSTQIREGVKVNPAMPKYWMPQLMNQRLFNDLRKIIGEVKPDLILLTGDLVYGGYDDKGTSFIKLADFLDRFGIPWAPVFGNHENESQMGVDWQCRYLESRKNCLFRQRTLTGNGNYSIGIVQDNELKRVIFMLDSNGCAVMSDESFSNGHSQKSAGFGEDQIEWYTSSAEKINRDFSDMKYTFAFHIQLAAFEEAFNKTYGFVNGSDRKENGDLVSPINIDEREDKQPTDFGYIGRNLKGQWDKDKTVYNGIKALGADSILVGHEHCNSASVVYDGIRFQYGQKIGEYDRINFRGADGGITGAVAYAPDMGTPIMGGTVMKLSEETGEISEAYIHYCSK